MNSRLSARMAVGLVVAGLLAASGCSKDDVAPKALAGTGTSVIAAGGGGGTLRLGVTRLDSLDPADAFPTIQSEMISIDLLFESLTTIDPATNEAVPGLASGLSHDDSMTTWTFPIRPDAVFSDGSPVTAGDVKFSLERIAAKGTLTLAGPPLGVVEGYADFALAKAPDLSGVRALDDKTVEIKTSAPFASLPELLASPVYGIVPKKAVQELKGQFGQHPVSSGLFTFVSQDDTAITLKKSTGANAKLDGVTLVKFADKDAAFKAFEDGKVDWAAVPNGRSIEDVGAFGIVQPGAIAAETFFAINLANPAYANVKFRQAIVKSIDRKKIAAEAEHSTIPTNGVVPPKLPGGSDDPCGSACSFDVGAAKALLVEAFPDGRIPTVVIDFATGPTDESKAQQRAAEMMSADLNAAGIPVTLDPKPFEEYRTFPIGGKGQVFAYGWVGLYPDPEAYLALLFGTGSQSNVTAFHDDAIDAAIHKARANPDRAARVEEYRAIEKRVMAQAPIVPLADIDWTVVVKRTVSGYAPRFDGTFATDQIGLSG